MLLKRGNKPDIIHDLFQESFVAFYKLVSIGILSGEGCSSHAILYQQNISVKCGPSDTSAFIEDLKL